MRKLLATLAASATLAAGITLVTAGPASAFSCTGTTVAADGDWKLTSTWTGGTVPTSGTTVCLDGHTVSVTDTEASGQVLLGAATAGHLVINSGGTLTSSSNSPMQLDHGGSLLVNSGGAWKVTNDGASVSNIAGSFIVDGTAGDADHRIGYLGGNPGSGSVVGGKGTIYASSLNAYQASFLVGADSTTDATPGTLTVDGGAGYGSSGTLDVVVAGASSYGKLVLTGSNTTYNSAGSVQVHNLAAVPVGTVFNVITSPTSLNFSPTGAVNTDDPTKNKYFLTGTAYGKVVQVIACAANASTVCTATTTPQKVAPAPPVLNSVTPGNGQASTDFNGMAAGTAPVTSYTVTATPTNAANPVVKKSGGSSPIVLTGLVNGEQYTFTVTATSADGTSGPSNSKTVLIGLDTGVSLLLSTNPVPVGHPLRFYGYVANHGVALANQKVALFQRLAKGKNGKLATVTTDARGQYTYNLRLVHTGAVRALSVIDGKSIYSKELLAKIAFALSKVKAKVVGTTLTVTGVITPGSPSPFGEKADRVAIYQGNPNGTRGKYIGDAKLLSKAKGASHTAFSYTGSKSFLGKAKYVYVNPLGTRANTSTHVTVKVH